MSYVYLALKLKKMKLLGSLLLVFIASNAFAQNAIIGNAVRMQRGIFPVKAEKHSNQKNLIIEKAPGTVVYSATFSSGIGSWTSSGPDAALWQYDQDGPSGQFSNTANEIIQSQSAGNGFLIFDADLSNPGFGPYVNRSGSIASPPIDLTGIGAAVLYFDQKYRTCCDEGFFPRVEVSSYDFVSFATFDATIQGIESNTISPTSTAKINLQGFIDTATNLTNVRIRFTFDGSGGATHYYWQIDDVKIREAYNYDLVARNCRMAAGALKLPYYFMPLSQVSPMEFSAKVESFGGVTQSNTYLQAKISNQGTTVSPSVDLTPGQLDSLITAPLTPPSIVGFYNVNYRFYQDSTDDVAVDDSLNELLTITDQLYSIDNNTYMSFVSNLSTQPHQPFKVGNVMEILRNDYIDSVYVGVTSTSTNVGQDIWTEVYKKMNGNWQQIAYSLHHTINMGENGSTVGLKLQYTTPVWAGDTLLVLACHEGGTNDDVRFRVAQHVEEGIVQGFDAAGTNFYLTNPRAVIVRLNMGVVVGLGENSMLDNSMECMPNPVANELRLSYVLNEPTQVKVEVVDYNGRVVATQLLESQDKGLNQCSLSTNLLNAGIYWVRLTTEFESVNKKFVKL